MGLKMLIEEVREKVRKYLDENPKRSITSLARKSGLSYSTVRRLVNNETTQCGIDTTIIPVLSVFMPRKDIHELIGKYDPRFVQVWKPLFDGNYKFIDPSQRVLSWKEYDQYIIGLAQQSNGVPKERIARDLGEIAGLKRAEELCSIGMLREVNGKYFTFTENYSDSSIASILEKISLLAKSFNQENIGRGAHYWIFSELLSDAAFEEMRQAGREYVARMNEIRSKHRNEKATRIGQFSLLGNFIDVKEAIE